MSWFVKIKGAACSPSNEWLNISPTSCGLFEQKTCCWTLMGLGCMQWLVGRWGDIASRVYFLIWFRCRFPVCERTCFDHTFWMLLELGSLGWYLRWKKTLYFGWHEVVVGCGGGAGERFRWLWQITGWVSLCCSLSWLGVNRRF
jgi:hypothetical protein